MKEPAISKKKTVFPISPKLKNYLNRYGRETNIPLFYDDLLRFTERIKIFDDSGRDTLWLNCIYSQQDTEEIRDGLTRIYSILHSDGGESILPYLSIDSIAFCTFGNTRPFRIKVRNIKNDNYLYLYIKKADASRIYGLELEHLLSPNPINFLVCGDTLIEEHIMGIPGDVFIQEKLAELNALEQKALAKEFVKFNERCFTRLLADMRSYNYVVVVTQDFDRIQYRLRAIDFDQQCYEGNMKLYKPQFFKENYPLVDLTLKQLPKGSVEQYVKEERSLLAKRASSERKRLTSLIQSMKLDKLSSTKKTDQLKTSLLALTKDVTFKKSTSMGQILEAALNFIVRNYENENPFIGSS
jgi:hypothetical protein